MDFEKYHDYLLNMMNDNLFNDDSQIGDSYDNGLKTMYYYAEAMLEMMKTDQIKAEIKKKVSA